ncbi:alpha/beta hydrolase [Streptomyces sp. TS71-3]|uniref:alpha/beta hydrolase n=1 Tax=Streptomyces sp. TS71-3 TaxID=2733862 RepID=UPI001B25CA0F|nr:alpha/beta fold hydrolase [Streptomyces sp. TS71-3]GHJ36845.1 hypothetical protein Sm713_24540 [Streptomyces sp. TS71-3]
MDTTTERIERDGRAKRAIRAVGSAVRAPALSIAGACLGALGAYRVYHPRTTPGGRTPENKRLPLRHMSITTSRDKLSLKAWVVPGEGPHTVVVCHGMSRTRSSTIGHIEVLHRAGYHVVAYDMRNHGESGRRRTLTRIADRHTSDLRDVVRGVRGDGELGRGHIAVLGFSFSTWPSLYLLRDRDAGISAVMCDSGPMKDIAGGFRSFAELARRTLPRSLRQGAGFRTYRRAFAFVGMRMLAVGDWPPRLDGVTTRLLFVSGAKDDVVASEQVAGVARRYPSAEYWEAPNAMHMSGIRFDKDEYRDRMLRFLKDAFHEAPRRGDGASQPGKGVLAHD